MVARSACEGVKKTRSDDSDGGSGAASVDVANSCLLLRKVGSDSKVPNDEQSRTGDASETRDCRTPSRDRLHFEHANIVFQRPWIVPAIAHYTTADVVE